jgi:hypothetical protein
VKVSSQENGKGIRIEAVYENLNMKYNNEGKIFLGQ